MTKRRPEATDLRPLSRRGHLPARVSLGGRAAQLLAGLLALMLVAVRAEAQYQRASVNSFSTSSTTFVDVPGGSLTFRPAAAGEVWVILLSARMRSTWTTSDEVAAETIYLVNGTQRGLISIRNQGANPGGSLVHFDRVTGTTSPQTVKVQLRDGKATATLENLQIIVFRLPAGADFQFAETLGVQSVPGGVWSTMQGLTFTPSSAGTYLVMALSSGRENPGSSTLGVRLQDPGGVFWPVDDILPNQRGQFENGRSGWPPFFLARTQALAVVPRTYAIEAQGDVGGSEIRDTRLMAFRTDVFDAFASVQDVATTSTTSTTPVVKSVLNTAAPPGARDHIVIQSLLLDSAGSTTDARQAGFERNDSVVASYGHISSNPEEESSYGAFDVVTTPASIKLENTYSTSNAAFSVDGKESVIHVLRLAGVSCCGLQTTEVAGSTITVTGVGQFEMRFNAATGGAIDQFFDLAEDPTRDLAGGVAPNSEQLGLFIDEINWATDGQAYRSDAQAARLDLLEATAVRARVRTEGPYGRPSPSTVRLSGVRGQGDYSVYAGGRLALNWRRSTRAAVSSTLEQIHVNAHYQGAGPLNGWTAYTQAGVCAPFCGGPAGSDFVMLQIEQPLARTDFLQVLSQDWPTASGTSSAQDAFGEAIEALWQTGARTIPVGIETWRLATYFKPTNFTSHADLAVTSRSADYRGPSPTPVAIGAGWVDANEDTASDPLNVFFNESEAAYVFNLNPATGLTFDMDGSGTTRYSPFFKIRQWRSLAAPPSITVESITKIRDADYKAEVKPVSRAHFADQLIYHSTLQNSLAVSSPDVGSGTLATENGMTYAAGRYGAAAQFDSTTDWIAIPVVDGGTSNVELDRGRIEFWYLPSTSHTDGVERYLFDIDNDGVDGGSRIRIKKEGAALTNELTVEVVDSGGTVRGITIPSTNYRWGAFEWVHLAIEWDSTDATDNVRGYLNGVKLVPVATANGTFSMESENPIGVIRIGNKAVSPGFWNAGGLIDEFTIYSLDTTPSALANGGLTSASEYLGDASAPRNFPLPFVGVNSSRQGQYLYLGSDAKVHGFNVGLATNGASLMASGTLRWEYWNGTGWADLESGGTGFTDLTNDFRKSGNVFWTTDPATWSPYSVNGGPDLYYVRAWLGSGASYSIAPIEGLITTDILLFQHCADVTGVAQTFVFASPIPTAVTLSSFTASPANQAVDLSWTTASELSNLGFHLYRSFSADGPWERITASLIPGLGSSPTGATYAWRDSGLANGTTYYYELEDVETTGRTQRHGPVSVTPQPSGSDAGGDGSGGSGDGSGGSGGSGEGSGGAGGSGGSGSEGSGTITWGDPSGASLRIVERGGSHVVLELRTPGFTALTQSDGTVRISIPGFEDTALPGTLDVPVRRALVEALAGRRARLASIDPDDIVSFDSFRFAAAGTRDLVVREDGTLRTGTSPRRLLESSRHRGFTPRVWARLLGSLFQGETKKARLELSPLRHDPLSGRTVLARRLTVRVEFTGTETGERSLGGSRGRRSPVPPLRRNGVFAQLAARDPGLYRIRFEDLFAPGQRGLPARTLRLSRLGIPVPYRLEPERSLFAQGSSLFFVSEGTDPDPRGESVFELSLGQTASFMETVSGAPSGPSTTEHIHTLKLEQNKFYQSALLQAPDLWLWDLMVSPITKSYPFTVEALSASSTSSHLKVVLQGASDFQELDHHLRLSVNGIPVGEATWDGMIEQVVETDLTAGILSEGTNTLAVENVGDAGAAYSMVFLNRFEVSYPRLGVAKAGRMEGRFDESGRAEVSGLPGTSFVVDSTALPIWLRDTEPTASGLAFRAENGRRYLAVSQSALLAPEVRKVPATRLRNPSNRADWVLIAPREFLPAAQLLVDLRRRQGLLPLAVATEDVFSEFGYGEAHPQAIRDFLAFAFHNWKTRPRYAVLLGDTTYDPKNYLGTGVQDRVPSPILLTSYLWTVSDPSLAAVNGDDLLPDLAIGRLSAGTLAEAQRLVQKLVAFEQAGRTFDGLAVLVADNADQAGSFEADQDEIAATVLQGRPVEKVYLRDLGASTRATIKAAMDNGPGLLSYVGHGATAVWASENVWNNTDLATLGAQDQQPLLLTLNCLNGFFHFPPFDSLAEAFVKAEGKGALAAFSPSGLSLNDAAHLYHKALLAAITKGAHARLGDAVLAAQQDYANQGAMPELLSIYHLLGDPGMRIR